MPQNGGKSGELGGRQFLAGHHLLKAHCGPLVRAAHDMCGMLVQVVALPQLARASSRLSRAPFAFRTDFLVSSRIVTARFAPNLVQGFDLARREIKGRCSYSPLRHHHTAHTRRNPHC